MLMIVLRFNQGGTTLLLFCSRVVEANPCMAIVIPVIGEDVGPQLRNWRSYMDRFFIWTQSPTKLIYWPESRDPKCSKNPALKDSTTFREGQYWIISAKHMQELLPKITFQTHGQEETHGRRWRGMAWSTSALTRLVRLCLLLWLVSFRI
ncbi:hypothetical protein BDE02_06G191200 [Populus trichocarpa]|nr:hypothetical protein BDE02_06G191200 [Populus trichocarpa]KAI5586115.1 hypothetical protein BDE02_06G191200 [Populus trichocarpa]KAI5586116.1 hypothetical protein BDE02_06G191200 [Populus trichocarpa]KAI5586117.1 hypothetical protein BDE02_06G191200 [Populus trichocarpa]